MFLASSDACVTVGEMFDGNVVGRGKTEFFFQAIVEVDIQENLKWSGDFGEHYSEMLHPDLNPEEIETESKWTLGRGIGLSGC